MNLNETIGKKDLKNTYYLKQRAIIVDKRKDLIVGLAPDTIIHDIMGGAATMKWFAYCQGKMFTTETLEGLFRQLTDIRMNKQMPFLDWAYVEKKMRQRVAIGTEKPFASIKKFNTTIAHH